VRFLLDTNVLSEVRRPEPNRRVLEWLDRLDEDHSFISVISLAEIQRGIGLMDRGRKRDALAGWLAYDLPQRFEGRVLAIDGPIAIAWGDLMASAKRRGIGLASMDGLLAATAEVHRLTLVTRNSRDFRDFGLALLDPWAD
jgi:predicted nucleic acid-binding protein